MLRIGWHISSKDIAKSIKEIRDIVNGFDIAIQIFSTSPVRFYSSKNSLEVDKYELKKYYDDKISVYIHSSYLINICNSRTDLQGINEDMKLIDHLDAAKSGVVLHLGKNIDKLSLEQCIQVAVEKIRTILLSSQSTTLLLETDTMNKKGSSIFASIENLSMLYTAIDIQYKSRIGFCIDTAHIWGTGYDIKDRESVENFFNLWENKIGIEKIKLLHLNDSKKECGSLRDLHEEVGIGKIFEKRLDNLEAILHLCRSRDIDIIIETLSDKTREMQFIYNALSKLA